MIPSSSNVICVALIEGTYYVRSITSTDIAEILGKKLGWQLLCRKFSPLDKGYSTLYYAVFEAETMLGNSGAKGDENMASHILYLREGEDGESVEQYDP